MRFKPFVWFVLACLPAALVVPAGTASSKRPVVRRAEVVELQPLAAQARRVAEALELLGEPLSGADVAAIERAGKATDFTLESAALGVNHRARIKPWEIRTLLIEGGVSGRRAQVREVNLLEV